MDQSKADQGATTKKECSDQPSNNPAVLQNTHKSCSQKQDGMNNPMDITISSTVKDDKDERPKLIRRKRSSSLGSLLQLKQFLGEAVGDQYDRIKLRRVSSIPITNSGGQETQLEDGLLTTTLCSTEL